jgi:2-polyprenyl-6-hydroxyphenyl methylase/3-demethylubiquinone-9 3-methyltransferase
MDFWHDVRDWLGGFPYEFATAGEIFGFVHERLGMELIHLNTVEGNACNEFLFQRRP